MSHFFAYLSRMKFIQRWSLMYNTYPENISEHSLRVAMIAHTLALIRNALFDGDLNPDRAASYALYHDATEVLTGDLPAPIKYSNDDIRDAYKTLETAAAEQLAGMLPPELLDAFRPYLQPADEHHEEIVKAADKLCAYLKCLEETSAGNQEFARAERALLSAVHDTRLPEVEYFLDQFAPSFRLTLDELGD